MFGSSQPLVSIEVEVSENWLPTSKYASAIQLPVAAPPELMALTTVPGMGVGVEVAVGVLDGVGVGVLVGQVPPGHGVFVGTGVGLACGVEVATGP